MKEGRRESFFYPSPEARLNDLLWLHHLLVLLVDIGRIRLTACRVKHRLSLLPLVQIEPRLLVGDESTSNLSWKNLLK